MEKSLTFKKALPTVVITLFIIVMMGLAFLPAIRKGNTEPVALGGSDGGAEEAFNKCAVYAEAHGFSTKLSGTIKARVFGVPYSLAVSGGRTVSGENFTEVKESASALVKIGIRTSYKNGEYYFSRGEYDDDTKAFVYETDGDKLSFEEFTDICGLPPIGLIKYISDGNVISSECIDENTYKYVLGPSAAEKNGNEVKTLLNSKKLPEYESIELTLITDGERAIKITATEKFRVDKFGGINCTATYTEVFAY